jgi:microcystin-dependent protein
MAQGYSGNYQLTNLCPTGAIVVWTTDSAPTGWLLCYGQAVDRTTYASLFAIIGTTFGSGDGSTTFNIPDMRGRFPLGQDDMGGSGANRVTSANADTVGSSSGAETHTLAANDLPAHNHSCVTYFGASSMSHTGVGNFAEGGNGTVSSQNTNNNSTSNNAVNHMNPYLTLNYIIKI